MKHIGYRFYGTEWPVVTLVILLVSPADALAYVDPGAGSYLFQVAAAALLAGTYVARQWSRHVIAGCWRLLRPDGTTEDTNSASRAFNGDAHD